jgi:regulatory protein
VGRELDRPLARTLARELRRSGALTRATRALAARDRSRQALERRLGAAGVAAAARAEALDALERAGLVDDARFAAGRAEALAERGWGDEGIRAELEREGIEGEAAATAIAGLEPERERAGRLISLRGASPATARYLAGRGFGEDAVEAALDGVVAWDA